MDKDDLNQTLDRVHAWTENCDTKTSIVVGVVGVVLTVILTSDYIDKFKCILAKATTQHNVESIVYILFLLISLVFLGIGCLHFYMVLNPKIDPSIYKEKGLTTKSLIFFNTISQQKAFVDYKAKLETTSEDSLEDDLISQIYICSKICSAKFNNYIAGLKFAFFGMLFCIFLVVIGFIAF